MSLLVQTAKQANFKIWQGKYATTTGGSSDTVCTQCAPGQYQSFTGQTQCLNCARGSISTYSLSFCVQCDAGQYQSENSCQSCPANSISLQGSSEVSSCKCLPGFTLTASTCTMCVAGKYKAITDNRPCSECVGSTDVGAVSCIILCPSGYILTQASTCVICPAGKYKESKMLCADCAFGFFSAAGSSECTACDQYLFSSSHVVTTGDTCACKPGFYGFPPCVACTTGTYKDTIEQTNNPEKKRIVLFSSEKEGKPEDFVLSSNWTVYDHTKGAKEPIIEATLGNVAAFATTKFANTAMLKDANAGNPKSLAKALGYEIPENYAPNQGVEPKK